MMHAESDRMNETAQVLKTGIHDLTEKAQAFVERYRQMEKELQQLKEQAAAQESANLSSKAVDINGVKLLVSELAGVEPKMLRTMVDDLKNQLGSTIIVLATAAEGKVSLIAGVSKDVTDRVKAGELVGMVAQQVGGKGGGRPDMAQAGGTDASALPAALASVQAWVSAKL
ncbi:alanine--tRNA ligase, partial [Citrobacter freundii]|uniref:DHHA1 domain-containing protein n=1 Tax=Citrobacter freundii TaxID=546 RepID=UPI001D16D392